MCIIHTARSTYAHTWIPYILLYQQNIPALKHAKTVLVNALKRPQHPLYFRQSSHWPQVLLRLHHQCTEAISPTNVSRSKHAVPYNTFNSPLLAGATRSSNRLTRRNVAVLASVPYTVPLLLLCFSSS